ncbi:MAG: hypothetical protein V1740_05355 [Candidatus Woesearchaeota archaeon]
MEYKHTQIGHLMIFTLIAVAVLFGIIIYQADLNKDNSEFFIVIAIMIITLLIVGSFTTLNVRIDDEYLRIKFGYGIYQRKFLLKNIKSVESVKNHWYYGWGIRIWFWPFMQIFNVSGFDAVEIKMKDGKIYRIGTDDQKNLEYAILEIVR